MRRLVSAATPVVMLLLLCVAAGPAAGAGLPAARAADPPPAARASWTVALYVDADNNLASDWRRFDVPELKRLSLDPRVNIVAAVDLPGRTGVRLVQFGGGEARVLASYYERNFGRQRSLTWFLRKVDALFPADHLVLDIWDHGGAWTGLCWDETSNDHLTMAELRGSFVEAGVAIDVLACDTCLTADLAVAYDVSLTGAVDYMVASEESVPGDGFAYDAMFAPLLTDPDRPVAQILSDMVDGYERYYLGLEFLSRTSLSAIDVQRVGAMRGDLQRWSAALLGALPADGTRIASDVRRSPWATWSYQVDVGAVAGRLAADEWLSSDELRAASAAVAADQDEAVLVATTGPAAAGLRGVSVWWGVGHEWLEYRRAFLQQTAFAAQTGWYSFLRAFNAVRPGLGVLPDDEAEKTGFNDVTFTDSLHGYAVGYDSWYDWSVAVVLRTVDGGVNWDVSGYSPWSATFTGVAELGGDRLATVGSSGYYGAEFLRFGGGLRQIRTGVPSSVYFFDVAADAGTVWAAGSNGRLLTSADRGRNWRRLTAAPPGRLTAVALADASHGWVASEDLMAATTTISASGDGGATFTSQLTVPDVALRTLQALDGQQVWACGGDRLGGDGVILHSADGGATWAAQLSGAGVPEIADVWMRDADTGWAVGDGGAAYRTGDGGLNWTPVAVPTTADLVAVTFGDERHGCIVGNGAGAQILVTADGGHTWREPTADTRAPVAPRWAPAPRAGSR